MNEIFHTTDIHRDNFNLITMNNIFLFKKNTSQVKIFLVIKPFKQTFLLIALLAYLSWYYQKLHLYTKMLHAIVISINAAITVSQHSMPLNYILLICLQNNFFFM